MEIEFIEPDFISDNDPEDIHERMLDNLPDDIDKLAGGFAYDFTMPTAIEKSELIQMHLVRTLMLMFPMWAWDNWLDLHASNEGLKRKEAAYASGIVRVTGEVGTRILKDVIFMTVPTDEKESVEFSINSSEDIYMIGEKGMVDIPVVAVASGKQSNVSMGTVVLSSRPIIGIVSITNPRDMTGGTEQEDDTSLRQRIQEITETKGMSFVGNDSDYIRWAKEVTGVGSASVVPEWNGPGTVKLILTDANGQPANENLIHAVFNSIMSPDDRLLRKAPIGAALTVVAPQNIMIRYSAMIKLQNEYDISQVEEDFKIKLLEYYKESRIEGIVKYTRVSAVLSNAVGVSDFEELLLNGSTANITLTQEQYPETGVIEFK